MTAGLSTTTFSTRQVLLPRLDKPNAARELTRRVSRTATLDGGATLTDQGFSDGDRTLVLTARVDEATAAATEYLLQHYATVTVSTETGCYLAALSHLTYQDGAVQVTALVQSKLSA